MNMCIHGTIATGVETLRARVEHNMARGASEFCSAWKLTDAGNKEFIWLGNITDMDGMGAFLSTEEELKVNLNGVPLTFERLNKNRYIATCSSLSFELVTG